MQAQYNYLLGANLFTKTSALRIKINLITPQERYLTNPTPEKLDQLQTLIQGLNIPLNADELTTDSQVLWTSQGLDAIVLMVKIIQALGKNARCPIDQIVISNSSQDNLITNIVFCCENKELSIKICILSVNIVFALFFGKTNFNIQQSYQQFLNYCLSNSHKIIPSYLVSTANRLGIPCQKMPDFGHIYGQGKYQRQMLRGFTDVTSYTGVMLATDKSAANYQLARMGVPVPQQIAVTSQNQAIKAAQNIGYPVVVKPRDTDKGVGISAGILDQQSLLTAFDYARQYSQHIVVESFIKGNEYRFLVLEGEVLSVAQRVPGHVVGDGIHTIKELIDQLNQHPHRRGLTGVRNILFPLEINEEALRCLQAVGKTLEDIPKKGEEVFLRRMSNVSQGGTMNDLTDVAHPDNCQLAVLAVQIIGLDLAGVDLIIPDVTQSWHDQKCGICEVNPTPGLIQHNYPSKGKPRDVAIPILNYLFPPERPYRIPVAMITGSAGKSTIARMLSNILQKHNFTVGLTSNNGTYVNEQQIKKGNHVGSFWSQQILLDSRIDVAILETSAQAIINHGTGVDECTVAAIANIGNEHLGESGIQNKEDLANVKGLLFELATEMIVVNADDSFCLQQAKRSGAKRICYISSSTDNKLVQNYLDSEECVIRQELENDEYWLVLCDRFTKSASEVDRYQRYPLVKVDNLSSSLGLDKNYALQNVLIAIGLAYGLGVEKESISKLLKSN